MSGEKPGAGLVASPDTDGCGLGDRALRHLLIGLVQSYRWTLSPLLGPACRFEPSCSRYAMEALRRHGAGRGGWLALRRLSRCHPFGGCGPDPVP